MRVLQVNVDDNSISGLFQTICRVLRKKADETEIDIAHVLPFKNEANIKKIEKLGADVYDIGAQGSRFGEMFQCRKRLIALLEEIDYDIVHIHSCDAYSMRILASAAKKANVPKVILHSHAADAGKLSWRRIVCHMILCRTLVMYGTDFVASSEAAGKWMFPNIEEEDVIRIRDGVSTAAFHFDPAIRESVRDDLDIPDNTILIGNISPFERQNNHEFMMDVLAALMDKKPETTLLLVGDGPRAKEIRQSAAAYGLSKNIIFYKRGKASELMQAMDAFVYPTTSSNLPMVVMQAQAAGLPTFLSEQVTEEAKVNDTVEFLPVKKESELIWAERILKRRVTPKKRTLGAQKIKRAGFGIARTIKGYLSLYQLSEEDDIEEV